MRPTVWHPYLPEPRPALVMEPGEADPVPLDVLRHARSLCHRFRVPPRQFRYRTCRGFVGAYWPATDIVAVNPDRADEHSMGGDEGYYAMLLHELLHATGHSRRLGRATCGDLSLEGDALEEGTVTCALRIVLTQIGFPAESVDWLAQLHELPIDEQAALDAAHWVLTPSPSTSVRPRRERPYPWTRTERALVIGGGMCSSEPPCASP
jgi:hypothetical protein